MSLQRDQPKNRLCPIKSAACLCIDIIPPLTNLGQQKSEQRGVVKTALAAAVHRLVHSFGTLLRLAVAFLTAGTTRRVMYPMSGGVQFAIERWLVVQHSRWNHICVQWLPEAIYDNDILERVMHYQRSPRSGSPLATSAPQTPKSATHPTSGQQHKALLRLWQPHDLQLHSMPFITACFVSRIALIGPR